MTGSSGFGDDPDTNRELNFGRSVDPADKDTTHVIAEMGAHHAGGVAGRGALWLHWWGGRQRGCGPHPVLYLPCHLPGPARPGPGGGESRARTLASNARCQVRQRAAAAKREPRPSVAFEKRGCSSGVSGILRGAGGTRTPSGETPYARQIFRTRGAAMPDLFPVPLRFVRRAGFSLEAFHCDLRRIFRAPSQSLPGSRSPSLASSMMNLASTTARGS